MSWWGKVIGGAFGFMLGGPLGAVLGAALGHNFDRGLKTLQLEGGLGGRMGGADVERVQSAFFTATFSVMGHVAKADGRVSEVEISLARDVMRQMRLNREQRVVAIRLFEEGKQANFPFNDALLQFKQVCNRRRNVLRMFLEIQVMTALADGQLANQERSILNQAAKILGFSSAEFEVIVQRIRAQQHFHQQGGSGTGQSGTGTASRDSANLSLSDAYKLLGIDRSASEAEVKKAYRRQMSQHHPDKLVSKGLPQEMMDIATRKTQDIKAAYDLIKKNRKF